MDIPYLHHLPINKLTRLAVAVAAAIAVCGCGRTSYNLATRKLERTFTSTEREVNVGRKLAKKVEAELTLVQDESLQERVRAIGGRLAEVCDRRELVYSFAVVKDEAVNAFSLPGGYVFVNDGLVKETGSDDELASVIAHEIAHVAARHAVRRFETGIGLQLLQLATLAAVRQSDAVRGVSVAAQAATLAYARQDELEADRLAVHYLKQAGFDPKAMLTFLAKLHEHYRDKLQYIPRGFVRPQYAMTHPYVADRLRAVKEELFGVADYVDYLNTSVE